jgi:hypothetical protein
MRRQNVFRLLLLPLPSGTGVCLVCAWMGTGPDVVERAAAHAHEAKHPTIARPATGEHDG